MDIKNKDYRNFKNLVIIFVILTGAGFGVMTGKAYSREYWYVAAVVGTISGYPLAKLYLRQLINLTVKGYRKQVIWFLSTLVAVVCGIICTTLCHGTMMLILMHTSDRPLMSHMDGFLPLVFEIGEAIGAGAGLVVGGICSLVYVLSLRVIRNEAA